VGQVSALYCRASFRALLWGKFLTLLKGKYPRSTVGQMFALYSGQVAALYCGTSVRALLWGKCLRSTLR
jgi:hypothetical protein